MPRVPSPLPDALPWRVFTRQEALRAGVSVDRLKRSDLTGLRRGLYARSKVPIHEADIAAALCRSEPDLVIVGLSAARLLGMSLPRNLETWNIWKPVHACVPGGRMGSDRVVRWRDLTVDPHHVQALTYLQPAIDPESGDGPSSPLRATTRSRTWRDLAPLLSHMRLVALGDHLVRQPRPKLERARSSPWCTIDDLRAVATGRHAEKLRTALQDVRVGADSPMETMLRLAFRDAALPTPLLNLPLIRDDGKEGHTPDFQWPEFRVCAEYDGGTHDQPSQKSKDIRRARKVRSASWVEVRLDYGDTANGCAEAIRLIREELMARGWRPS